MNFKLNFSIPKSEINLKHGDSIVTIGSCFSDSMTNYFENAGFEVLSNPFGTLFHPIALSNTIFNAINQKQVHTMIREDLYFAWEASGTIYGYSRDELVSTVERARTTFIAALKSAKIIVITLGSAWGYVHDEYGIVANCHKAPQSLFKKELSEVEDLIEQWTNALADIQEINPNLKIVFTVSPVRHTKDGLIENNRSKARLIEFAHRMVSMGYDYFPSYEVIIDELRDYRFYKNDLVHPSDDATKYVWECFRQFALSKEASELSKKVEKINATLHHESLYDKSQANKQRIESGELQRALLSKQHPEIYWRD